MFHTHDHNYIYNLSHSNFVKKKKKYQPNYKWWTVLLQTITFYLILAVHGTVNSSEYQIGQVGFLRAFHFPLTIKPHSCLALCQPETSSEY